MTEQAINRIARRLNAYSRTLRRTRRDAPRCWECGRSMTEQARAVTPFCSTRCEYKYNEVGE